MYVCVCVCVIRREMIEFIFHGLGSPQLQGRAVAASGTKPVPTKKRA